MTRATSFRHLLLCAFALGAAAGAEAAPQVLSNPTVADLVRGLSQDDDGPVSKALDFSRTAAPNLRTHLCASPKPAAEVYREPAGKNLEVIPYSDGALSVNLAIQFESGTDRLEVGDKSVLNRLALAMQLPEMDGVRFAVAGHTDQTGGNDINLPLSCARAIAVRSYLVTRGVAAERLTAYGFGSKLPLNAGRSDAPENRRVEIRRGDL